MSTADRMKLLRAALIVVGLVFLAGVYPLTLVWPAGWAWHHSGQSLYLLHDFLRLDPPGFPG